MVDPFNWLLCDLGNPRPLWTSLGACWVGVRQWPHKAPRCVFQAGLVVGSRVGDTPNNFWAPEEQVLPSSYLIPGPRQWCELSATL